MIKKILGKMIPMPIKKQLTNFFVLSNKYAQYKTIKYWNCIDRNGKQIPWYTYPTIEYLNNIDFGDKLIFEYGSGNSSHFWAERAKEIVSVENDKVWFEKVKQNINNNQEIFLCENKDDYLNSIKTGNKKYDVVIIDGMYRSRCSHIIDNYLNKHSDEGCMVILDNSDWYQEISKYLREELNLIEIDFHGFGPINAYTWTTSIFLSRNFNFKPINGFQPNFSISAIQQGQSVKTSN